MRHTHVLKSIYLVLKFHNQEIYDIISFNFMFLSYTSFYKCFMTSSSTSLCPPFSKLDFYCIIICQDLQERNLDWFSSFSYLKRRCIALLFKIWFVIIKRILRIINNVINLWFIRFYSTIWYLNVCDILTFQYFPAIVWSWLRSSSPTRPENSSKSFRRWTKWSQQRCRSCKWKSSKWIGTYQLYEQQIILNRILFTVE